MASLVLVSACRPETARKVSGNLRYTVDSTAHVFRVRSSGTAPLWRVEPIVRVGSEGATGVGAPDEFGHVSSVTTDEDGNVWVADAQSHDIRVFRPDGSLLRRIGREGQGPGEFLSLYSLAWVGDVLLVLDPGNGRVAELSREGQWLGTRPAPGGVSGPNTMIRFYPIGDTTVYQWGVESTNGQMHFVWIDQRPSGPSGEWPQLSLERPRPSSITCRTPGAISYFDLPFGGQLLKQPAGQELTYAAWTEDYRIAVLKSAVDTVRVIERDRPQVPIQNAEWQEAQSDYVRFRDKWPGAQCTPPNLPRPEEKPAFRNLLVDTSGRLWVEAYTPSGFMWDVFDAQGYLRGSVPGFSYLPSVPVSVRGDLLAWVEADSLGVERVTVARMRVSPS